MNFFKGRRFFEIARNKIQLLFRSTLNLTVKTYAQEEVSFPADPKKKVREIFDKVCNLLSVRETWFFGLTFLVSDTHSRKLELAPCTQVFFTFVAQLITLLE